MDFFTLTDGTTHPLLLILLVGLGIAVVVQLYFILRIFTRLVFYQNADNEPNAVLPPVSIIVCAHNESANLRALIPLLAAQVYPQFEIIVVNDRSTDDTEDLAKEIIGTYSKVRFIHVSQTYDHVTPKKYALTTAIRQSAHDVVLLTDADCRPASTNWIAQMAGQLASDKDIVLGFSPYFKELGFLNRLIRLETFYGAVQYFSLALAGKPYMGVGRNLLYRKKLFLQNKGFYSHLNVMGGDDDLLMNEIANATNTSSCLHPDSFMYSIPKQTWEAWSKQKKRHLSVSKYYQTAHKRRLGLLSGSHVLGWCFFVAAAIASVFLFETQPVYMVLTLAIFGLRLLAQWVVLGLSTRKLGHIVAWYAIPFFDFVLFVYYIGMAVVLFANRKKKIQWR